MAFSLDTNMVVGLLIKTDRLHSISERVFKFFSSEQGEKFVLALHVIAETRNLLQRKINRAVVKIIPVIPKLLEISNPASIKFQTVLIEKFRDLKKNDPNLSNFYEFVYECIIEFLKKKNIEEFPNYLAELAIESSRSVDFTLYQRTPECQILSLKEEQFGEVMKIMECLAKAKIRFSNPYDAEIFYAIVLNLSKIITLTFISDDSEFIDKIMKSNQALIEFGYGVSGFRPLHHSQVKFSKEE